ncbi:MAG: cytochrome-c peroxidase [Sphingomonadales bacterium]|nr:cytochrome-c peroxidase [Sphingomonadales bacterium]
MMKSKQLTGLILAGATGLTMLGMVACDGDKPIGGVPLKTPNLANASSFDYEHVTMVNGTSLSVKDMILGRSFRFTNTGFPNTGGGSVDKDMEEAANTFSNASAKLGRVLFYDKRMSLNNAVSCGSCHHQSLGFSDRMPVSVGFGGKVTRRNSMSINNPVSFNNLFWDSRAQSPMDLSLRPVFDHIEMGMESDEMLEKKLAATDFYGPLFQEAFGSKEITRRRISLAITHFVTSMVTMNSKNDKVNEGLAQFTMMEKMGHDLFFSERASCFKCHSGSNFSAPDDPGGAYGGPTVAGTANVGLDKTYADNGKGNGKFRIPSLRNIELSAPYMHDGRFGSLESVIDHYSRGIQAHPHLDANLKDERGNPKRMNFTAEEKDALIAFLHTLTDVSFISNPKYSDPFAN